VSAELAVAVGAAVGAPARYLLDQVVQRRVGAGTPTGILAVNLLGSLAAGVVAGAAPGGRVQTLLAVGLLGSFTTASTLAWDVLALDRVRDRASLLALHVVPGVALAAVGLLAGRAL
jgi:CrcB protein